MSESRTRQTIAREVANGTLVEPDWEDLVQWERDGGCEAACPDGCWVEPDGTCPHNRPSWLVYYRLI